MKSIELHSSKEKGLRKEARSFIARHPQLVAIWIPQRVGSTCEAEQAHRAVFGTDYTVPTPLQCKFPFAMLNKLPPRGGVSSWA